jgi:hypothetical protein
MISEDALCCLSHDGGGREEQDKYLHGFEHRVPRQPPFQGRRFSSAL